MTTEEVSYLRLGGSCSAMGSSCVWPSGGPSASGLELAGHTALFHLSYFFQQLGIRVPCSIPVMRPGQGGCAGSWARPGQDPWAGGGVGGAGVPTGWGHLLRWVCLGSHRFAFLTCRGERADPPSSSLLLIIVVCRPSVHSVKVCMYMQAWVSTYLLQF